MRKATSQRKSRQSWREADDCEHGGGDGCGSGCVALSRAACKPSEHAMTASQPASAASQQLSLYQDQFSCTVHRLQP